MESQKKVAVIAGGAGGIGTQVALRLARDDFIPIILDRDEKAGAEAIDSLRREYSAGQFIALQLTQKREVQQAFSRVL